MRFSSRVSPETTVYSDGSTVTIRNEDNWYGEKVVTGVTIPMSELANLIKTLEDASSAKRNEW
jgi:hypothetical protein